MSVGAAPRHARGTPYPGIVPLRRHSYFENPAWECLGIDPDIKTLVNREDLAAVCASIRQANELADVVVVSCHWGILEDRMAIAGYQREAAHAFIDNGADVIMGHGPFFTKGIEVYRGKVIFYSLAKFATVSRRKSTGGTARSQCRDRRGEEEGPCCIRGDREPAHR